MGVQQEHLSVLTHAVRLAGQYLSGQGITGTLQRHTRSQVLVPLKFKNLPKGVVVSTLPLPESSERERRGSPRSQKPCLTPFPKDNSLKTIRQYRPFLKSYTTTPNERGEGAVHTCLRQDCAETAEYSASANENAPNIVSRVELHPYVCECVP